MVKKCVILFCANVPKSDMLRQLEKVVKVNSCTNAKRGNLPKHSMKAKHGIIELRDTKQRRTIRCS